MCIRPAAGRGRLALLRLVCAGRHAERCRAVDVNHACHAATQQSGIVHHAFALSSTHKTSTCPSCPVLVLSSLTILRCSRSTTLLSRTILMAICTPLSSLSLCSLLISLLPLIASPASVSGGARGPPPPHLLPHQRPTMDRQKRSVGIRMNAAVRHSSCAMASGSHRPCGMCSCVDAPAYLARWVGPQLGGPTFPQLPGNPCNIKLTH